MAGILAMICGFAATAIYSSGDDGHHGAEAKRGYSIDVPEVAEGGAVIEVAKVDIGTLLAEGDIVKGEKSAKLKCASCHTFDAGGANKTGPNLAGIVGANKTAVAGFPYSKALTEKGGTWTYEELNDWLENPSKFAKGSKMVLKVKKDQERANIIMYLKSLSPSAPAIPAPAPVEETAPAAEEASPAAEEPAAKVEKAAEEIAEEVVEEAKEVVEEVADEAVDIEIEEVPAH